MTTGEILRNMTDAALFERLGNAVLRIKFPQLTNLIASGINPKGKTIKGTADAFAQIEKNHYARIAYTTNATNLERKWLNENITSHSLAGDLISILEFAEKKRLNNSKVKVSIFLVTNQIVSPELDEKVRSKVSQDFITIEIVENSNIAEFLDYNPLGQYFRKQFLNIDALLLSAPLLKEIMEKNLTNFKMEIYMTERKLIETSGIQEFKKDVSLLSKKLALIINESGSGKSTAVLAIMNHYFKQDYCSLRIDPQIIELSNSISSAIEKQLLKEYPKLYIQKDDIDHFFGGKCIIVIDDINRHENAATILEKLVSWMQIENNRVNSMRILCPVWPKNFSAIENIVSKEWLFDVIKLNRLTKNDAVIFIRQSLTKSSVNLSDSEIEAILKETKDDLLLLTLYTDQIISKGKYIPSQGQKIVDNFIEEKLNYIEKRLSAPLVKVKSILQKIGIQMLRCRLLNPEYEELEMWLRDDAVSMQIANAMASESVLFYIDRNGVVIFRHDQIKEYILIFTFQSLLIQFRHYLDVIQDPFYSELIGAAISKVDLIESDIDELMTLNPLAVYYSLKFTQELSTASRRKKIEKSILKWNDGLKKKPASEAVIRSIGFTLIGFDIQNVDAITCELGDGVEINLARFRNGIAEDGIKFFMHYSWFTPTFGNYWRDIVLDHVKKRHHKEVVDQTNRFLGMKLTDAARPRTYVLAGYLRSPKLIQAIQIQWYQNKKDEELLYYLWAIINCFNSEQVSILLEALDSWAILSESRDQYGQRAGLKNTIFTELSRSYWELNTEQIKVLLGLLSNSNYSGLLYGIIDDHDSPIALEAVIKKLANDRDRNDDKHIMNYSEDRWDFKKRKQRLSEESRSFLLSAWKSTEYNDNERYYAFRFWCGNEEPQKVIKELRSVQQTDKAIYDSSIFWRTRLNDQSVMTQLFELIGRKWWAIRVLDEVWNKDAKVFFKDWFSRETNAKNEDCLSDGLEVMRRIDQQDAEEILVEHWESIRLMHTGFLTALYIATPKTRELARQEINRLGFDNWEDIKDYYQGPSEGNFILSEEMSNLPESTKRDAAFLAEEFRYAYFNYGYFNNNTKRKLTLQELDSLIPYLPLIGKHGLGEFAEQCQRNGYNDWFEQHLFPLLSDDDKKRFRPTNDDIVDELGTYLTEKHPRELDMFLKELNKRGVNNERFIESLQIFSKKYQSLEGLYLLCKCIEEMGTRADLAILDNYHLVSAEHQKKADSLKANTLFTVFRKNLK